MQALAAGDDDKFGKFMGMRPEGRLRVTPLDTDGKAVGMEPLVNFKDAFHLA
ncbi:MAG: hypothetical protein RLZZ245_2545 [Verrucomicrobiota bacterium]